jgi:hypothetical protein
MQHEKDANFEIDASGRDQVPSQAVVSFLTVASDNRLASKSNSIAVVLAADAAGDIYVGSLT